jgi:hypothetical protein
VTEHHNVFLSCSWNDPEAGGNLRGQLAKYGLSVFKDDETRRAGDLWLDRPQRVVDRCGAFVVLVGRDGVRRWIGAETQPASNRYIEKIGRRSASWRGAPPVFARTPVFSSTLSGTSLDWMPQSAAAICQAHYTMIERIFGISKTSARRSGPSSEILRD